ncbi:serine hydrolase domain-containing protein [Streptomyces daliensis]
MSGGEGALTAAPAPPAGNAPRGGGTPRERLEAAIDETVRAIDAPDVVVAVSVDGHRTVRCGGTAPLPPVPRDLLRYEIGSASKTYAGLLLAALTGGGGGSDTDGLPRAGRGPLSLGDPAVAHLDPGRPVGRHPVTLLHLITHTSGLPPLPADFYPQALRNWSANPYAGYSGDRVVDAFLRSRPRHRPGTRWRYSNFGVSVLGHTLAAAMGTPWEDLLTSRVLTPLGLTSTALRPGGREADAVGRGKDGVSEVPPLLIGGLQAAGAVRATPHDLLTFLEAHLRPGEGPLSGALRAVRHPLLRRGLDHRHVHTLTWFQHPGDRGPVYFHAGATRGQQAFLGFSPETGTAVAVLATRRLRVRGDAFTGAAYALLTDAL